MFRTQKSHSSFPCAGEFDVVVAGGSCTGVFAAIRAAQRGRSVALIEMSGGFGGTCTQGLVPVWHTLYSTDGQTKIIQGLTEEILDEMARRGEARMYPPGNEGVGALFNIGALQMILLRRILAEKNITVFLHTRIAGATCDRKGHVASVTVADKSGLRVIRGRFFIDATGDADVCRFAGFPVWRLPKHQMQAHTVCAILSGTQQVKAQYPEFSYGELLNPRYETGLSHRFGWDMPIIGAPGLTFHAYTRICDCDPSIPEDLTRAEMEGQDQLRRIVDAANRHFPLPDGQRISLVSVASHVGLRESCHIQSLYRLTANDLLTGRHFHDVIAKGSYRVDIHEGDGISFRYLDGREQKMVKTASGQSTWISGRWRPESAQSPTWYEIPYRCMVPREAENVLAPGRALDCERDAFGGCRVMVNCNQMGEAAGIAAARAVAEKIPAPQAWIPL